MISTYLCSTYLKARGIKIVDRNYWDEISPIHHRTFKQVMRCLPAIANRSSRPVPSESNTGVSVGTASFPLSVNHSVVPQPSFQSFSLALEAVIPKQSVAVL